MWAQDWYVYTSGNRKAWSFVTDKRIHKVGAPACGDGKHPLSYVVALLPATVLGPLRVLVAEDRYMVIGNG